MAPTGSASPLSASCLLSSQQIKIKWLATEAVAPLPKHTLPLTVSQKSSWHQGASSHLSIWGTEVWVLNSSSTFRSDRFWWCRDRGFPACHRMFSCIYSLSHVTPKASLPHIIQYLWRSPLMDQRKAWHQIKIYTEDRHLSAWYMVELSSGHRRYQPKTWWQGHRWENNDTGMVWNRKQNSEISQLTLICAKVKAVPGT